MIIDRVVTIDGNIVEKEFQKGDICVYKKKSDDDSESFLYFVCNDKVLFTQRIVADCGQNYGFISSINFEGVK